MRKITTAEGSGDFVELFFARFKELWPRPRRGTEAGTRVTHSGRTMPTEAVTLRGALLDRKDELFDALTERATQALTAVELLDEDKDGETEADASYVQKMLKFKITSMNVEGNCSVWVESAAADVVAELWMTGLFVYALSVVFEYPDIDGAGFPNSDREGADEEDEEEIAREGQNEDRQQIFTDMNDWIILWQKLNKVLPGLTEFPVYDLPAIIRAVNRSGLGLPDID